MNILKKKKRQKYKRFLLYRRIHIRNAVSIIIIGTVCLYLVTHYTISTQKKSSVIKHLVLLHHLQNILQSKHDYVTTGMSKRLSTG